MQLDIVAIRDAIRIVAQRCTVRNSSVDQAGSGSRSRLEHVKRVAASSLQELPANRTAMKASWKVNISK